MIAAACIALDTNVLLRHLIGDDFEQKRLASAVVARAARDGRAIYISLPVLCETVWALDAVFEVAKGDILRTVRKLLDERRSTRFVFRFQHETAVRAAVEDYAEGNADFADYLIGQLAHEAGAVTTYTFDKKAAKAPTFKLLRHG